MIYVPILISPLNSCIHASFPECGSTLECLSASVRSNMDTSANPCEDFYQYSCGGWIRNARNPKNKKAVVVTTRFEEVNAQNTESLRDVIKSGKDGDVRAVQLARQFYDSCMDTGFLDMIGSRPLKELVWSMGGWSLINIFNGEFTFSIYITCRQNL